MPEPDRPAAEAAECDRHAQVAAVTHPLDPVHRGRGSKQRHAGIAQPERLQARQLVGQLERGLGRRQHGVDALARLQVGLGQGVGGVGGKGVGEGLDVCSRPMVSPAATRWPPNRCRWSRHAVEAGVQIVGGDAATGPLCLVVAHSDQDDRPAVALHEPRGHDPHHALVPLGRCQHVCPALPPLGAPRLELVERVAQDRVLDHLALAVERLQAGRQRTRPRLVAGQQQLERLARMAQAAGGVDPRCEPEADVGCAHPRRGRRGTWPSAPAGRDGSCARAGAGRR